MSESYPRAGFFKRIFVIIYDWLAVIALAMLLTVLNLMLLAGLEGLGWLDLAGYADHSQFLNQQWWFKLEMLLAVWFFYAWFWYDGGQTLGMRAWRLKVRSTTEQPLTLKRAMLRALYAGFGLGNLLVLFTPKTRLSIQDKLTDTEVVVLTKEANKKVYLRGVESPDQE